MFEQQQSASARIPGHDWQARVDDLATQVMVAGTDPDTSHSAAIQSLRELCQEFHEQGAEASGKIAAALIAAIDADAKSGIAHLLKSGLADLRYSLEPGRSGTPTAAPASLADDAELVADFLVEAREHLSKIEGQMLILERDPAAMEVIHAVFRAFHTIKGLAGFLDFQVVQAVSHEVETLLDHARNEKLTINSSIVDVVLESGDFLHSELAAIERSLNSNVPLTVVDNLPLLLKIRQLAVPGSAPEILESTVPSLDVQPAQTQNEQLGRLDPQELPLANVSSFIFPMLLESDERERPAPPSAKATATVAVTSEQAARAPVSPTLPTKETAKAPDATSVRVETAKLDHLMNMVGEIVIAQSLIRHNQVLASAADSRLLGDLSQLARVTAEVQRATMSMRMVPVGQLFQRVERVIRDLSRKAGKQVVLETSGTETEIDKTVAEELSDPLLHMVRNSIDHGIEPSAERLAKGKPPEARVRLSAYHQGGQVIIAISDDGRGLDSAKIRRKAEDRQLIAPGTHLTEEEVYQLIFEPGFSTAEQITDISGRGVGMDVVRRNVEKLRGRIETESIPGKETKFLLKLPLTLAIIDGLIVEVGAEHYIIPLSGVREIFRPRPDSLFTVQGRDEMMLVREELMPVVRLHQRLGIPARAVEPSEGLMVVVESENRCYCLMVDDLLGKQEVVIKSLGDVLKDVPGVSGCAVLGDGQVGLILDTDGIYRGKRR